MTRHIALLRGINVGGHRVIRMETLRRLFEALPLADVSTYIQSGNVLFTSKLGERVLRERLEQHLAAELGDDVTVVLRTQEALAGLVAADPFAAPAFERSAGPSLYVAFLASEPSPEAAGRYEQSSSDVDVYRVRGREVLIACHKGRGKSRFSATELEKKLGTAATVRNWNVVSALAREGTMAPTKASPSKASPRGASSPKASPAEVRLACVDAEVWWRWLSEHHASSRGVWLQLGKKGTGPKSVTYAEAVEAALAWGWIDGQKQKHDDTAWLQRFTPRTARSPWSKLNRDKAMALIAAGRMAPPGLAEVERAKKDGRWEAAYDSARTSTVPEDLAAALAANARAQDFFATLDAANRYAILYRVQTAKKPETRARRIADFVAMLARHETLHPPREARSPGAKRKP